MEQFMVQTSKFPEGGEIGKVEPQCSLVVEYLFIMQVSGFEPWQIEASYLEM